MQTDKMDLGIYTGKVTEMYKSMIAGEGSVVHEDGKMFEKINVLNSFYHDNDIQEMTLVSTNIGFIRKFTKEYKK